MPSPEPDLQAVFQAGLNARHAGSKPSDNPYPIGSPERDEWGEGFRATCDLDEEDDPASDRLSDAFD